MPATWPVRTSGSRSIVALSAAISVAHANATTASPTGPIHVRAPTPDSPTDPIALISATRYTPRTRDDGALVDDRCLPARRRSRGARDRRNNLPLKNLPLIGRGGSAVLRARRPGGDGGCGARVGKHAGATGERDARRA